MVYLLYGRNNIYNRGEKMEEPNLIVRQSSIKAAVEYVQFIGNQNLEDMLRIAERIEEWVLRTKKEESVFK